MRWERRRKWPLGTEAIFLAVISLPIRGKKKKPSPKEVRGLP